MHNRDSGKKIRVAGSGVDINYCYSWIVTAEENYSVELILWGIPISVYC